jgi:hypothetical protein
MGRLSDRREGLDRHDTTNPIGALQMRTERRDAFGTVRMYIDQGRRSVGNSNHVP